MTTSRRGYVRYPFAGLIIGLIACGGIFQGSNIGLVAQDLQYNCISCADKFDKCEIDCAWTLLVSLFVDKDTYQNVSTAFLSYRTKIQQKSWIARLVAPSNSKSARTLTLRRRVRRVC